MANQIMLRVRFVSSNLHRRFIPRAAFTPSQSILTAYGCKLLPQFSYPKAHMKSEWFLTKRTILAASLSLSSWFGFCIFSLCTELQSFSSLHFSLKSYSNTSLCCWILCASVNIAAPSPLLWGY